MLEMIEERLHKRRCFLAALFLVFVLEQQFDEAAVRRIEEFAAQTEFRSVKPLVILTNAAGHGVMFRIVRLNDYVTECPVTSGSPRRLRNEHETTLCGAEIRQIQARIGADDADGRNVRDVMAFRDHLRAEQDVIFVTAELFEDLLMGKLLPRRVAVHADDAGLREDRPQFLFELFRARTEIFDIRTAAFRADRRHGFADVAVMTDEASVLMIDERHTAFTAFDDFAARAAHNKCRITAPVQHDDNLLVTYERLRDELLQLAGQNMTVARFEFAAHVNAFDLGERHIPDAVRHREEFELALLRAVIRLAIVSATTRA